MGAVATIAVVAASVWSPGVVAIDLVAAFLLVVGRARHAPELAWLTLGLLLADLVTRALIHRAERRRPEPRSDADPGDAPTAPARP